MGHDYIQLRTFTAADAHELVTRVCMPVTTDFSAHEVLLLDITVVACFGDRVRGLHTGRLGGS